MKRQDELLLIRFAQYTLHWRYSEDPVIHGMDDTAAKMGLIKDDTKLARGFPTLSTKGMKLMQERVVK